MDELTDPRADVPEDSNRKPSEKEDRQANVPEIAQQDTEDLQGEVPKDAEQKEIHRAEMVDVGRLEGEELSVRVRGCATLVVESYRFATIHLGDLRGR